jgi:hypothetical protein
MIRYRYNQQVAPPGPFVHVTIRRPADETSVRDIPALIDTAADMTVISWRIVDELQLLQHDEIETLGIWSSRIIPDDRKTLNSGKELPLRLMLGYLPIRSSKG